MRKTFEVEGDLTGDVLTLLALELGIIYSQVNGNKSAEITVFYVREGVEQVFEKFGLKVIGAFD